MQDRIRTAIRWLAPFALVAFAATATAQQPITMRIAFKGRELAALELVDGFGQRSELKFSAVSSNPAFPADRFKFVMPAGADLIEQ